MTTLTFILVPLKLLGWIDITWFWAMAGFYFDLALVVVLSIIYFGTYFLFD